MLLKLEEKFSKKPAGTPQNCECRWIISPTESKHTNDRITGKFYFGVHRTSGETLPLQMVKNFLLFYFWRSTNNWEILLPKMAKRPFFEITEYLQNFNLTC